MKQTTTLLIFVLMIPFFCAAQEGLVLETINQHSLQFSYENHDRQDVSLEYGLTPTLELGAVDGLTLFDLKDATFYYVKAKANRANRFQESSVQLVATASKSPGDITVYFNQPVDNNASLLTDAIYIPDFEDTLVAYIDRAQMTLDVCNYNTGSLPIVNAVNAAKARGVTVRYIAADNTGTNNNELSSLASSIPMIQRPNDGEVMHNKFLIIDIGNSLLAKIITGSTNHTNNSCHQDYNNMVIVEDQTLALAYQTEFEEMWGSNTTTPNLSNSKFGDAKADNTPHNFNIGGIPVELYFSPSDGTTAKIEAALMTADTDLQFATLTFINNDLGDAIIDRHNTSVDTKGIIENIWYFGSEYNGLKNAGVDVYSHLGEPHTFHHKYGIVDANNIFSDPLVITGSHNWTNSAEDDFDENTLIIHDAVIANMYFEEFMQRFVEVGGTPTPTAFVVADVRTMLQGPLTSNNIMDDGLRALSLIPTTEPYTALGHTPVNHPGGESIIDLSVLNVTGPSAIVDWVFVQLLDKNDVNTVLATRSGLIRRDGNIVDMDGTSPLRFDNIGPDNYYIAVSHRNHLRVHSTNTIGLNATSATVVDFGNSQNPITPVGSMTTINNNLAMWAGDASNDNIVNSVDRSLIWNARNTIGYSQEDLEMNGSCQASDRSIGWNNRNRIGM